MPLFRKKPVVIEAVQLTEELMAAHIFDKALLPFGLPGASSHSHPPTRKIYSASVGIETLEGQMRAEIGDWIIKGVKGELYPCKPDIFAATYEPATPPKEE